MSEHTPLPRNSKGEIILNEVFDGKVWAQEFMRIKQETNFTIDESLMLAWFANAIMAGYDHANAKLIAENKRLREALTLIIELGRKDTSNSKYDGYYETARQALNESE